ncbi:hypothetical protein QFC19_005342 [Naganishia cerealis]|uniref:Uncharacterized protein n=1 Tax=Naganishia cerealis TaxID=610337 RepID=A0ACC2VQN2_9TREE|nr:hypothetical protein QFC19_005342 [Naganishia cerealis]
MAAHKGPLGDLPGMTFDPVRNRYFPTREEEERPVATPPEPNSLRAGFRERLKRGRQAGRTTQAEVSGRGDVGKVESRVVKARNPRSKAATPSRGDRKNTSSHLDPDVRRIDKTLLRTTGLDLGRYDRFPLPTHAESQKRRQWVDSRLAMWSHLATNFRFYRRERSSLYSRMTSVTPYDEPTLPSALTVMSVSLQNDQQEVPMSKIEIV